MFKLNSISLSLLRRGNLLKKNLYSPLFTPLPLLSNLLAQSFAKMSKPAKKITLGDKKKSLAASDEKGAKLAKEEEAQEKKKKIEAEKKKIERSKIKKIPIKTFDMSFDLRMSQLALDKIALQQTRVSKGIRAASNLQEKMKIKQETKTLKERKHFLKPFLNRLAKKKRQQNIPLTEFFKTPNDAEAIKPPRLRRKTS